MEKSTWGNKYWRKQIEYYIDSNGCHICISHRKENGYPIYAVKGKNSSLSRFMYIKHKGPVGEGLCIRHTCDNKSCINPDHLLTGTLQQNNQDMKDRNRYNPCKGEKNAGAKIKDIDVINMRKEYKEGVKQKVLANKYQLHICTIRNIVNRKSWKHIEAFVE